MRTITAKRSKNKPKNFVILFSAKINHKSAHDFHYCTTFISATLYETCSEVCHGLIKFKSITIVLRIILKVFQCQYLEVAITHFYQKTPRATGQRAQPDIKQITSAFVM